MATDSSTIDYSDQSKADVYAEWEPKILPVVDLTCWKYFGELEGKTVVDFGCGAGDSLKTFAERKAFCLGIDINEAMIKSGGFEVTDEKEYSLERQLSKNEQVAAIVKDCFKPFDRDYGQFDLASCHYCVQYCSNETDLRGLLKNILKLLKPGGKLYIGQPPYLANTIKDQNTIADTTGCVQPMKSEAQGKDPFYGVTIAVKPLPESASKTGRPFTREKLFTFEDYFWSKEKVMASLERSGFVNVKLLEPCFPPEATEEEKRNIHALEEPFVLVGAEKPRS